MNLYFVLLIIFPQTLALRAAIRGSTIDLAGCGIWLILRAGFGTRAKNRSGKRDFKYKRERDNAFLRDRDAGIVRCSPPPPPPPGRGDAGDLTGDVGHSIGDADDGDEYESSSSAEEEEFQENESQILSTLSEEQTSCLVEYQHSVELFGSITGLCFDEVLE